MKTSTFGMLCMIIMVFTVVTVLQVCNIGTRETYLSDNLQQAMNSALSTAMEGKAYTIADSKELVADVVEKISLYMTEDADLKVDIFDADPTTGILSMRVTATYTSSTGKPIKAVAQRTLIVDTVDNELPGTYVVRYHVAVGGQDTLYKTYNVQAGSSVPVPADPPSDYADSFTEDNWWVIEDGHPVRKTVGAIREGHVDKDMDFYATKELAQAAGH